jgi:hypothetical protein
LIFDIKNAFMIYQHFFILFEVLPISFVLSLVFFRLEKNEGSFLKFIFWLGCLQSLIALSTFILPDLRNLLTSESIVELGTEGGHIEVSDFRIFGFARSYLFSMPLFLGICTIIGFLLSLEYKSYYIYLALLLPGILLNARIGLIGFVFGFVVYLFSSKGVNSFLKSIILLSVVLFLVYNLFFLIQDEILEANPYLSYWLDAGINSMYESSDSNVLFGEMWFLPEIQFWILGSGELPYRNEFGLNSDIGYVQIFYFGGILYSFLMYFPYLVVLFNISRSKTVNSLNILLKSMIWIIFISNFKGNAFYPSEHILGFILLFSYFQVKSRDYNYFIVDSKEILQVKE